MSEAKGKGGNMALCTLRCFITTKLIVNRLNYCLCEEKKEKKEKEKGIQKKVFHFHVTSKFGAESH